jgi:hypothetical protein
MAGDYTSKLVNRLTNKWTTRLVKLALSKSAKAWLAGVLLAGVHWGVYAADEQRKPIAVRPDSPASYTVQQGDTLWDIAGRFLEQPWQWPQVWQVNPQIQDPDLIYPGDTITLSYVDGQPVLSVNRQNAPAASAQASASTQPSDSASVPAGIRTERRSPSVRRDALVSPIPAIPLDRINAFLSKNSVMPEAELTKAPYLLGERQGKTIMGTSDEVFARGEWTNGVITYDIVREGRKFADPDSGEVLGVEALMVGSATITGYNDDRALMRIDSVVMDGRIGDRLVPRQAAALEASYLPQPPAFEVNAAIVSIGTGNVIGGQYDTLVLNVGSEAGLAPGNLLSVQQPGVVLEDEVGHLSAWQRLRSAFSSKGDDKVEFPGKNIGSVLIYKVYDHASLGFVLSSSESIRPEDRVVTP